MEKSFTPIADVKLLQGLEFVVHLTISVIPSAVEESLIVLQSQWLEMSSTSLGMTNVAVAHPSSVSFAFTLLKSGTTRASSLQSTYRIIPARSITKVARFGTPLMPSPICGRKDS